jgi:hypothetical protein
MTRKTETLLATPAKLTFPEWKARVRAEMQERQIPVGYMREKQLRDLFILGRTPDQAAEQAVILGRYLGGEGGIRTPDTVTRMPHFECGAFNRSATSPCAEPHCAAM